MSSALLCRGILFHLGVGYVVGFSDDEFPDRAAWEGVR